MITFTLVCAGLILFSGLFYLLPDRRQQHEESERGELNLEWYRLRQAELAREGNAELLEDMKLRLLEDLPAESAGENSPNPGQKSFPRWILLPLVAIASSALYYQLGSAPDVQISKQLKAIDEQTTPEQMQDLMLAIELRSQQRPENLHYRAMLGRFYMGQEDYRRAADTYSALAMDAPGDDQILAYAAQSEYLASNRTLGDNAQMLAEQSLAINPHQRTALGLLGMAAFEQGQYRAAIEYWERLIEMEPEGSEAALMIAGIVERAREKLGDSAPPVAKPQPQAEVTAGVTVRVSLPPDASIPASSTVFILARGANSDSRMPIAVQRLQGADLPAILRLDDSTSMAGQKLSQTESIVVVVQVSPDGRPGAANATWLGNAGPLAPSLDAEPLEIVLRAVE
ncbi:MAG: c-type cytochrome biogenesis protein CcmI [Proteobacteria bacterium]|nr:c-type cytochrome biogenesis protein CcmI [Pseudomonadota bacterium]